MDAAFISMYIQDSSEEDRRLSDFRRFSTKYRFEKPNDRRAIDLMNAAATGVLEELPDICFAYGLSDEFR